jgi:uncharacterized membrane protein
MFWFAAPNLLAMATSLAAVVLLSLVIRRIGGQIGAALRLLSLGVFLSVFLHAGAELAEVFGLLSPDVLMVLMGSLVTSGSLAFCAGGVVALRAVR